MRNSVSSININANGELQIQQISKLIFRCNLIETKTEDKTKIGVSFLFNSFIVLHTLPNGVSMSPDAQLLQNQIAVIQQQQQQQKMLHNALTRTISHQPTSSELQLLQSNLDAIASSECHRKLERTQSEPAPQSQVNTSR